MVALGFTGVAAFQTCVYLALATTSALNALLLLVTTPLLTVFGAWALFRDPVTTKQLLGLVVSLVGAVLLIARGSLSSLLGFHFGAGDLWMLLAVVLWAAYSLLLKKRPAELPQSVVLTASAITGIIGMLPVYVWTYTGEELPRLRRSRRAPGSSGCCTGWARQRRPSLRATTGDHIASRETAA